MKLKLLFLLALLSLCTMGMAQSKCHEYAKYGLKYLDSESYKDALRYLDWAIELCPDSAECYFYRGICYDALKDYDKRENDFKKFAALENGSYHSTKKLGGYYSLIKEFDKSIAIYTEAINKPGLPDTLKYAYYLKRGAAKHSIRNLDGALEDYKNAYNLDSSQTSINVNISGVLSGMKLYDEAEKWLLRAAKKDTSDLAMLNNLGLLYVEQKLYKKAISYFDKVIENTAGQGVSFDKVIISAYSYGYRGFCKFNMSKNKEALKDYNKSIEIYSTPYVFKNRALLYLNTNKSQEACDDLVRALALGFTRQYGNEAQELYDKHCR